MLQIVKILKRTASQREKQSEQEDRCGALQDGQACDCRKALSTVISVVWITRTAREHRSHRL
jgi:hypothetical protein